MPTHEGLSHTVYGRPYNLDTWSLCRELARGLAVYSWHRISYSVVAALERRRMNRIRRHPVALIAACAPPGGSSSSATATSSAARLPPA
jgi:hypothetical protein